MVFNPKSILTSYRITFIATRYFSAFFVAVEILLFARLLGPESYGHYALIVQVAGLLLFVAAGSGSGYVYAYYKCPTEHLDRDYLVGALGQYLLGALLAALALFMFQPYLIISVILFLIYMPYLIVEPMLRVRNHFTAIAICKGLGSLATLGSLGLFLIVRGSLGKPLGMSNAVMIMILGNLAGYAAYYLAIALKKYLVVTPGAMVRSFFQRKTWAYYWSGILLPGLPLNASSVVFLVFTYVDRLFIDRFRPAEVLSVYALAWQLSQIALLTLTSLNLVSGVRIGELLTGEHPKLRAVLRRQLGITAIAGGVVWVALLGGAFILSATVYRDYAGLVLTTGLLSIGYVVFYVVGSITSLLFYERRLLQLTFGYAMVLIISLGGNLLAIRFNLWYTAPVALSSLSLIIVNIWLLFHTWNLVRGLRRENVMIHSAPSVLRDV